MAWKKLTLTTALNTSRIAFAGRGSIYAEGTFGGGTVGLHVLCNGVASSGFIDDAIDGTSVKSIDCPAGSYELNLDGSAGATVDLYYNDQVGLVVD